MKTLNWQLEIPIDAIIFDCDGTLSAIEGIDELAKNNGVTETVQALTEEAMGKTGINPTLYQKRLDLVRPTQKQVIALGHQYFINQPPDVRCVIRLLKDLNKLIYIVSAGLYPAVKIFAELLQIPAQNVFAVDITFDAKGQYIDYEHTSPLVYNNGKCDIVKQLKLKHPHIVHVGDGLNDYATYDLVTRFVGYGGIYYRDNIASRCEYYIHTASMAPLLPLILTQEEVKKISKDDEKALYAKGVSMMQKNIMKPSD